MPENYQPPKFQQFNDHGILGNILLTSLKHAIMLESMDILAKQFVLSLKDAAFDWYIDLEANIIDSWDDLQNKFSSRFYNARHTVSMIELVNQHQSKDEPTFGELATRAYGIEMSLNCKEDECLVDANDDDGDDDDDTTP
ncbi:UNVERIFIED_CONTAM: hypothetical protein Slati_1900600 [Sesamum latifolium]|uniref:Retrotransposon gag domain-containing protein n=1 Tax=Sesamum latifolium TaxID=2727402 RepID=A0AAW2X0Z8_9LAMI